MKKFTLLLIFMLASYFTYSQDVDKIKELGFTTNNLNDFGITYRTGSEKSLWRFNAISSSISKRTSSDDSSNDTWTSLGFGVQFGKEWRKLLSQKFELRYGLDLAFNFSNSKDENFDPATPDLITKYITNSYRSGINAVLGFNFVFAEGFLVGAEFQPAISYSKEKSEMHNPNAQEPRTSESDNLSFGLSTDALRLSLIYRF